MNRETFFVNLKKEDNSYLLLLHSGALETIRTFDPYLRRVVLYPTELRAHELILLLIIEK